MKITVVCDVLGEENNGATHAGMNFIRSLQEKGHEVTIVCPDEYRKGQENYYVCPARSFGPFNNYVRKVGVTIAKADDKVIEEAIKNADIIHCHLPFTMSNHAIKLAQKYNIPLTASFHMQAENFTCHIKMQKIKPLNTAVYKFIYKHTYRHVDAVHYPTDFIRQTFESRVKKSTNGYVISNGVNANCQKKDVQKPENLKDKFVILSTGRYCTEKAQDVLIKAVAKSKYKNNIHLILAGQGPKAPKYKKLAQKLGVPVQFSLFSRSEIADVINYCDLYVHPARVELEGIACLEAITCGRPTIVSDSKKSATKFFAVDERCIFKNNDATDLARVIDFMYENEALRKEIGDKYYASSEKYNQAKCMDDMEKMLFETIENHKKANTQN
ncbi:MAG: glycosyltransferase [Clostridia bacterium]|nr:glycosyltransferase [Clostridia bacterium]